MRKVFVLISVVWTVALLYIIIYIAVTLPAFNMWFYNWQFSANNTYSYVSMESGHLDEVTRHMITYLRGDLDRDSGLQIQTVVNGSSRPFFSGIEIRHMVDVYDLFVKARFILGVNIIYLAVVLFVYVFLLNIEKYNLFKIVQVTTSIIAAAILGLGVLIAFNWHKAFRIFHEIFFNNNDWKLDSRVDLLIRIVPNNFFMSISGVIGLIFGGGILLIIFITGILKK